MADKKQIGSNKRSRKFTKIDSSNKRDSKRKQIAKKKRNIKDNKKNINNKNIANKSKDIKIDKQQIKKRAPKSDFVRKLRIRAFYMGLFLFVILLGLILSVTVLFKIDDIEVRGQTGYDDKTIIDLSGIKTGENLLLVNTNNAEQSIVDALSYVANVKILRSIPNKIVIEVEKAQGTGVIEMNGQYALISDMSRVLEVSDENIYEGYTVIKGSDVENVNVGDYVSFSDEEFNLVFCSFVKYIKKYDMSPITQLDLTNLSSIIVLYDDRITIKFGDTDKLEYKVQTASQIVKEKLSRTERGVLDLSVVEDNGHSYFMPNSM